MLKKGVFRNKSGVNKRSIWQPDRTSDQIRDETTELSSNVTIKHTQNTDPTIDAVSGDYFWEINHNTGESLPCSMQIFNQSGQTMNATWKEIDSDTGYILFSSLLPASTWKGCAFLTFQSPV
jgi:hypothetical protein